MRVELSRCNLSEIKGVKVVMLRVIYKTDGEPITCDLHFQPTLRVGISVT